jgi:tetratricopeptide (TPR) repeat protein
MTSGIVLTDLARQVELETCVTRLFSYLFPGERLDRDRSGRYRVLEEAVEAHPVLLNALRDDERDAALEAWWDCAREHSADIAFHHTLAVIYREKALAEAARQGASSELLVVATALWGLLLETRAFWRQRGGQGRISRTPGSPDDETALLEKVARELFAVHLAHGDRALTTGQTEVAAAHLRCLAACRAGPEALIGLLEEYRLPYAHTMDRRPGRIATIADEFISSWCTDIVRLARVSVDDPDVIRTLPPGIKKNYQGGIRHIEPFVGLGVPVARVLWTGLEWYNGWSYCLYTREDRDQIKQLMGPAHVLANQLAPLCTKGRGHVPANQALSQHYLLRGFVTDDPEAAQREYEESLEWNPANSNAADLLEGSIEQVFHQLLDSAVERVERHEFEQAHEVLDAIEQQGYDQPQIRRTRAIVYVRHGQALAEDGHYRDALDKANEALRFAPDEQPLQRFAQQMAELVPEEENLAHLRAARTALDDDEDYARAISIASRVRPDSRFAEHAWRLRSAAYYYRAVEAANAGKFASAATDLRNALGTNSDPTERDIIQQRLTEVEQALTAQAVDEALKRSDWTRAFELIDSALAESPTGSARKELARYLSSMLNAHAVQTMEKIQQTEREFGAALTKIVDAVERRLGQY